MRRFLMLRLMGIFVQFIQAVIHPAIFHPAGSPLLLRRPIAHAVICPVAQVRGNLQCFCIPCILIGVHQSLEQLVRVVPGNPGVPLCVTLHDVKLFFHIADILHVRAKEKTFLRAAEAACCLLAFP